MNLDKIKHNIEKSREQARKNYIPLNPKFPFRVLPFPLKELQAKKCEVEKTNLTHTPHL